MLTTEITTSTTELVRAAAEGDERAWELVVQRYSGSVWSAVRTHRLADRDAADVVAATWLQLAQNLSEISEPEAVGAWLATTAERESLRALRWIGCERPIGSLDQLESADRPEDEPEAQAVAAERDMLQRCIDELPERDQALLRVLLIDPPLSYEEISSTLGIPIDSIGLIRARCLQRLRQRMNQFERPIAGAR